MRERKSVARAIASRYQKASKREKWVILDEFTGLTGYTRCYASYLLYLLYLLGRHGKRVRIRGNVVVVGDLRTRTRGKSRYKIYDSKVLDALKEIWLIMGCICGKRLAPVLKEVIGVLQRHKEIGLESDDVREKLLSISAAIIDRLLREEKKRWDLRSRSHLLEPGHTGRMITAM